MIASHYYVIDMPERVSPSAQGQSKRFVHRKIDTEDIVADLRMVETNGKVLAELTVSIDNRILPRSPTASECAVVIESMWHAKDYTFTQAVNGPWKFFQLTDVELTESATPSAPKKSKKINRIVPIPAYDPPEEAEEEELSLHVEPSQVSGFHWKTAACRCKVCGMKVYKKTINIFGECIACNSIKEEINETEIEAA